MQKREISQRYEKLYKLSKSIKLQVDVSGQVEIPLEGEVFLGQFQLRSDIDNPFTEITSS